MVDNYELKYSHYQFALLLYIFSLIFLVPSVGLSYFFWCLYDDPLVYRFMNILAWVAFIPGSIMSLYKSFWYFRLKTNISYDASTGKFLFHEKVNDIIEIDLDPIAFLEFVTRDNHDSTNYYLYIHTIDDDKNELSHTRSKIRTIAEDLSELLDKELIETSNR